MPLHDLLTFNDDIALLFELGEEGRQPGLGRHDELLDVVPTQAQWQFLRADQSDRSFL